MKVIYDMMPHWIAYYSDLEHKLPVYLPYCYLNEASDQVTQEHVAATVHGCNATHSKPNCHPRYQRDMHAPITAYAKASKSMAQVLCCDAGCWHGMTGRMKGSMSSPLYNTSGRHPKEV